MNKKTFFIFISLVILLTACNLPSATEIQAVDDSIVRTSVAATLTANAGESAVQQPSAEEPEDTQTPTPTNTLESSATPSITPSPTESVPTVSVSVNTNCRTGPGQVYDLLGALLVGENATVIARNETGSYWVIKNPDGAGNCWLWDEYATVTGDTSNLPVMTPPPSPTPSPTPTPAINFIAQYENFHNCGGTEYITFYIGDTGPSDLESAEVKVVENSTSTVLFDGYTDVPFVGTALGCPPELSSIGPGAVAFIAVPIGASPPPPPNPGAHTATIKICSEDGLEGHCLTKTVNFTIPSP